MTDENSHQVSAGDPQDSTEGRYALYRTAQADFDARRFTAAAKGLEEFFMSATDLPATQVSDARLLLARAYFHTAQFRRAELAARAVLEVDPQEGYAAFLLGKTLERVGRPQEAQGYLLQAQAMGVPREQEQPKGEVNP